MRAIPDQFEIKFEEFLANEKETVQMTYQGKPVGDALGDLTRKNDGYRYHDIFHVGFKTMLDVGYVIETLLSSDDAENNLPENYTEGCRLEEGLCFEIFNEATRLKNADNKKPSQLRLNKFQSDALIYWEKDIAIDQWQRMIDVSCDVFQKLHDNKGGIVSCDRIKKEMTYRPA